MIVGVGAPKVYDFTRGSLPSGATIARTSSGAVTGPTGLITVAAANAPRLSYDPLTHLSRGLTIEAAATNEVTTNMAAWGLEGLATTAATSPTGDASAFTLTEFGNSNSSQLRHRISFGNLPIITGVSRTLSVFVKMGDRRFFYYRQTLSNGSSLNNTVFDLVSGTVAYLVAGVTATITAIAGGWFRVSATYAATLSTNADIYMGGMDTALTSAPSYTGTGIAAILWQPQVEIGTVATSPIIGSTTRAADALSLNAYSSDRMRNVRYVMDDGSTSVVATQVTGGRIAVPTNLPRPHVKSATIL